MCNLLFEVCVSLFVSLKYAFERLVIACKLQHSTTTLQVKDAWLPCDDRALCLQELVDVLQEVACQLQKANMHLPMTTKHPLFTCRQWK